MNILKTTKPALSVEEARKYNIRPDDIAPMDANFYHVQPMCLFNDLLMKHFFHGQKEIVEKMLCIILEREVKVDQFYDQKDMPNTMGLSPCLDMLCVDENQSYCNIEVQNRVDAEDVVLRSRFNASSLTQAGLQKGSKDYKALKSSIVILILRTWFGDLEKPMYHIDRRYLEEKDEEGNNLYYGDGDHIILVNGQYLDTTTDIGKLMHDFSCANTADMQYDWLRDRMSQVKNSREEVMDIASEDQARYDDAKAQGWKEGVAEGRLEGMAEGERNAIVGMLEEGLGIDVIMRITKKPLEYIKSIADEIAAKAKA